MACCGRGIESLVDGLAPLWSATRGDPRVCIAVLDGTVDSAHAAFDGARLRQLRTSASFTPAPPSRHGTHIASVLFGQHDGPVPGVTPRCQGAIVPVFRQTGSGQLAAASQLDLARAISLALTVGANVINISGGKYDPTGEPEPYLAQVIELCAKQNVLVVAAAGNDGCACPHVPAASPWVLAVGAMDERGEPLESSNWSSGYRSHGLLAPGRGIPGADPGGGQILGTGTSFATAVVSGVAGLLMSVQLQKDGTIDARAVHDAILQTTKGCEEEPYEDCNRLLGGRLDVARAWKLLTANEANMMSNRDEFYAGPETHSEGKSPSPNMSPAPGCSPCNSAVEPASENNVGRAGIPELDDGYTVGTSAAKKPHPGKGPGMRRMERPPRPERRMIEEPDEPQRVVEEHALVFALGNLAYDFGTEARKDAFTQQGGFTDPPTPQQIATLLENDPWHAVGLTWLLVQENAPLYAIKPSGAFANLVYARLRDLFDLQLTTQSLPVGPNDDEGLTLISVAGTITGSTTLINSFEVPVIRPDIRLLNAIDTDQMAIAVLGPAPGGGQDLVEWLRKKEEIKKFLRRLYFELSNMGIAPQHRAINYAATNIVQITSVFTYAIENNLKLDTIEIERSALCRPNSDCWDVKLILFDPAKRQETAREVYRLTIDVSDVIPVSVGKLRNWSIY